jgi:hypothetical protein
MDQVQEARWQGRGSKGLMPYRLLSRWASLLPAGRGLCLSGEEVQRQIEEGRKGRHSYHQSLLQVWWSHSTWDWRWGSCRSTGVKIWSGLIVIHVCELLIPTRTSQSVGFVGSSLIVGRGLHWIWVSWVLIGIVGYCGLPWIWGFVGSNGIVGCGLPWNGWV